MAAVSRKIGLRNEKFATKVTSTSSTKTSAPRRTISFYVLAFLLFVLVCSGTCFRNDYAHPPGKDHPLMMLRRILPPCGSLPARCKFSSERARMSERLWNTLVPERNWTPLTPQFWVLLAATVSLYCYNRRRSEEGEDVLAAEKRKHAEAVSRMESSSMR
ncbi:Cytoplasmic linker protein [Babesia ovata]|uniref:Cytoplasmic linker protein n=1 Tax=Babesia ovata TaxID=189622 RepID=A0A2H6K8X6_9APIC|nr:Cytoplasmic linker protein [Babesia ovata]GBE59462.1 Cytoplasmic linker protein [Babesia ovata]